jgi:hypothetical protein
MSEWAVGEGFNIRRSWSGVRSGLGVSADKVSGSRVSFRVSKRRTETPIA